MAETQSSEGGWSRARIRPTDVPSQSWLLAHPPAARIVLTRDDESIEVSYQIDTPYGETNAVIDALGKTRIGDQTFDELLQFEGIPMWQFAPAHIWPDVHRRLCIVRLVTDLIEEHKLKHLSLVVTTSSDSNRWVEVLQGIASNLGLSLELVKEGQGFRGVLVAIARRAWEVVRERLRRMKEWGVSQALRLLAPWRPPSDPASALMLATFSRHWVRDPYNPEREYDEQFSPLLASLRHEGWQRFIGLDLPYGTHFEMLRTLRRRRRQTSSGLTWTSWSAFGQGSGRLRNGVGAAFVSAARQIDNAQVRTPDKLVTKGVSLFPILKPALSAALSEHLPNAVHALDIAERAIRATNPAAILLTYETGPYQRALIIKAGEAGIPTIGLQHGMIFPNHYDYMHDSVTTERRASRGFIVPTVTCVWGPLWKSHLTEIGTYPDNAVAITGNWRYDRVLEEDINATLEQGSHILILSAAYESTAFVSAVLDRLGQMEEVRSRIRVKPHPSESPERIAQVLREHGLQPEVLVSGPLIPALRDAAIVISQPSTSVGEAILMARPVILIDEHPGEAFDAYSQAAIHIRHVSEINTLLSALLSDESLHHQFLERRRRFVKDFFLRLDGQSAQRVARVVTKLVQQGALLTK